MKLIETLQQLSSIQVPPEELNTDVVAVEASLRAFYNWMETLPSLPNFIANKAESIIDLHPNVDKLLKKETQHIVPYIIRCIAGNLLDADADSDLRTKLDVPAVEILLGMPGCVEFIIPPKDTQSAAFLMDLTFMFTLITEFLLTEYTKVTGLQAPAFATMYPKEHGPESKHEELHIGVLTGGTFNKVNSKSDVYIAALVGKAITFENILKPLSFVYCNPLTIFHVIDVCGRFIKFTAGSMLEEKFNFQATYNEAIMQVQRHQKLAEQLPPSDSTH